MYDDTNDIQPVLTGLSLPLLAPLWPSRPMAEVLLNYLIRHGSVTVDEFHKYAQTHEVRKLICVLLDHGWPFAESYERHPQPMMPVRVIKRWRLELSKIDFTKVVRP